MFCLDCGTEMTNNNVKTHTSEISYDMCEKCGSLWLDAGELDKMAFTVEGSIEYCESEKEAEPEAAKKECPRCENFHLSKVRFLESENLFLHYCTNCGGFWLAGGELKLIDKNLEQIMPVRGKGFSDFVNNVHVPYWFRRVQKKSSATDVQYEVLPVKGAKPEGSTTDICPVDGTQLDRYKAFSMQIEACPKCHGMWLVRDELRRLKNKMLDGVTRWVNDEIENLQRAAAIPTKRKCVRDKSTNMVSVIFGKSKVVIDLCPKCEGTWLDQGSFEAINDYLRDELGTTMSPAEMKKHAEQDLERVWSGGPESRFDELRDGMAAASAYLSALIFEHPVAAKAIYDLQVAADRLGA
jgi:Zn-finger nucleic acid-binding protein